MRTIYESMGERIHHMRLMRGYTREFLAEKAEISSKFLYEIETGRKGFSVLVLYNLCQALQVDSDYILHGKHGPTREGRIEITLDLNTVDKSERLTDVLKEINKLIG